MQDINWVQKETEVSKPDVYPIYTVCEGGGIFEREFFLSFRNEDFFFLKKTSSFLTKSNRFEYSWRWCCGKSIW